MEFKKYFTEIISKLTPAKNSIALLIVLILARDILSEIITSLITNLIIIFVVLKILSKLFSLKINPNKIKIIGLLVTLILIFFAFYISKYQQLVNEGSQLADEHCITINPLIIKRKQAYIDSIKLAKENPDLYMEENNKYLNFSREYINAEKKWLDKENIYLNREDVKLLIDKETQKAGMLQYRMYLADYEGTEAIVKSFETKDEKEQTRLLGIVTQTSKDLNEADAEYAKMWENRPNGFDIRNYFIKIPPTKCPQENYSIPDVGKELGI